MIISWWLCRCGYSDFVYRTVKLFYFLQREVSPDIQVSWGFPSNYSLAPHLKYANRWAHAKGPLIDVPGLPGQSIQVNQQWFLERIKELMPKHEYIFVSWRPGPAVVQEVGDLRTGFTWASFQEMYEFEPNIQAEADVHRKNLTGGLPYEVLHIRLGDMFMQQGIGLSDEHYRELMKKIKPYLTPNIVLISDSNWLKCKIAEEFPDVRVSFVTAVHSGNRYASPEDARGVVFDIDLVKHCQGLTLLTQEGWGFVRNVATIFGIRERGIAL